MPAANQPTVGLAKRPHELTALSAGRSSRSSTHVAVRCSVLQCVAVPCSLPHYQLLDRVIRLHKLQCVAVYCSVLQCVVVHCTALRFAALSVQSLDRVGFLHMLQCAVVCCSVLQCIAVSCSLPHYQPLDRREVGGWGRVPFSKKLMSPTPRRKWYLTTGRRAH